MKPPAVVEPASASAHGTVASAFGNRPLARGTAASAFAKRPLPAFAGRPPAFASRGHQCGGLLITFLHITEKLVLLLVFAVSRLYGLRGSWSFPNSKQQNFHQKKKKGLLKVEVRTIAFNFG